MAEREIKVTDVLNKDGDYTYGELRALDAEITKLLKKRADIVSSFSDGTGFPEKYFVFNNEAGKQESETFVLNPINGVADIEALKTYAQKCSNPIMTTCINDWLGGYTDYRCYSQRRGKCPLTDSPVCCAHCPDNNICVLRENTPICSLVMIGDVVHIEDCEEV